MAHTDRLHSLDALRALALLMGVALHATMSFVPGFFPGIWSTVDPRPSVALGGLFFVTHIFRMTLFFVIAGYFTRLLVQRRGVAGFWANRLMRIGLPLLVGAAVMAQLIPMVWMWGLREYFGGRMPPMPAALGQRPPDAFPLAHLWFLYYLLLLYAGLMLARAVLSRLDPRGRLASAAQRLLLALVRSGAAPLALALPAALAFILTPKWLLWVGVPTPDSRLLPQLAPVVAYGAAFTTGWLMHRAPGMLELLARRWLPNLLLALLAVGICVKLAGPKFTFQPVPGGLVRLGTAGVYSLATWSTVLALTGLALRFMRRESRTLRYLADASYWVYLAHLPLVAALAVVVRHWPVPAPAKFAFIVVATMAVLLASYQLLVRPTVIGRVLNGRVVPLRRRGGTDGGDAHARVPPPARTEGVVAELCGVTRRFGPQLALDDVDLQVHRGELLALLGPNGAGKSTAIGLWLGLAEPDAGEVRLLGGSPLDIQRRRGMGVMMQDVELARGMRVRELVAQTSACYAAPRPVQQTLALAGIEDLARRDYDKLSGGQKRKVQFALAICGRPSLLFLDEPSTGLDVGAREGMWRTIRQLRAEGCSIVLTTHYLEEAEALADRVVVLAQGRVIASGTVDQIRAVVSRREIRCESALASEVLQQWPGVIAVSRDAQRLCLTVTDAEDVLRRLLAEDRHLCRLEVRQAGLAEAFAHLTQEAA